MNEAMPGLSRRAAIIVSGGSALGAAMNLAGCASRSTVDPAFLRHPLRTRRRSGGGHCSRPVQSFSLPRAERRPGDPVRRRRGGEGFSWSGVATVNVLETMLYRTAERLLGRTFREAGRKKKKLAEAFELYLSVPRGASFAVTLKLSQSNQPDLPGVDDSKSTHTMKELLDNLELLNNGDIGAWRSKIPDAPYRRNFIALAESWLRMEKISELSVYVCKLEKKLEKLLWQFNVKCCASESTEEHANPS